jgi:Uma2 family endonuclease
MAQQRIHQEIIIATGVSFENYMEQYAADFAEWVDGNVIKMSPITDEHADLSGFLYVFFTTLLSLTGGGRVFQAPMVMKPTPESRGREPDLQIILPENYNIVEKTKVAGAADLVVEIVSLESSDRDRGEKFAEYEREGVKEYWIFDPLRHETLFYVRDADGLFKRQDPDEKSVYHSTVLPKLTLPIEMIWRRPLPNTLEIVEFVKKMLNKS